MVGTGYGQGKDMGMLGRAALSLWMDVAPGVEDNFDRWYREQHFPERLGVPGFLRARRYGGAAGSPAFFILYETENADVLRSPAYMERLNNPTEWTRRVLPGTRNVVRSACRLVHSVGAEEGQAAVTLRLDPVPGRDDELRRRYQDEVLAGLAGVPGVVGATLFEAEPTASVVMSEERKLVALAGTAPPFLCVCEAREPGVIDRPAWKALTGPDGPARRGIVRGVSENAYRLLHTLRRSGT